MPPPPGIKYDTVLLLIPKHPELGVIETIRFEVTEAYDGTSDWESANDGDSDIRYSESEGSDLVQRTFMKPRDKGKAKQHDWELAVSVVENRESSLVSAAYLGKLNCVDPIEKAIEVFKQVDLGRCTFEWVKIQWYWLAIEVRRGIHCVPKSRSVSTVSLTYCGLGASGPRFDSTTKYLHSSAALGAPLQLHAFSPYDPQAGSTSAMP